MEEQELPEDPPINASKFKYIGVWILCAFLTGLINQIVNLLLLRPLARGDMSLDLYFVISALLVFIVGTATFIFIYNRFKTINIRKVMPFLYVLGTVGLALSFLSTYGQAYQTNLDFSVFYLSFTVAFIAYLYVVRSYYIKKPTRWY